MKFMLDGRKNTPMSENHIKVIDIVGYKEDNPPPCNYLSPKQVCFDLSSTSFFDDQRTSQANFNFPGTSKSFVDSSNPSQSNRLDQANLNYLSRSNPSRSQANFDFPTSTLPRSTPSTSQANFLPNLTLPGSNPSPSTNNSYCNQPSSSNSYCNQPSTSNSYCNQPSTSNSYCNQPSTSQHLLHQPSTSNSYCNQPSTSQHLLHQPSQRQSNFPTTNQLYEASPSNTSHFEMPQAKRFKRMDTDIPQVSCSNTSRTSGSSVASAAGEFQSGFLMKNKFI